MLISLQWGLCVSVRGGGHITDYCSTAQTAFKVGHGVQKRAMRQWWCVQIIEQVGPGWSCSADAAQHTAMQKSEMVSSSF